MADVAVTFNENHNKNSIFVVWDGDTITHRNAVSSNDGAITTADSGIICTGWPWLAVDVLLGGTNPQWDVTPYFSQDSTNITQGEVRTVTETTSGIGIRYYVEVAGCPWVFFKVDNQSGTTPTITVKVTPYLHKNAQS